MITVKVYVKGNYFFLDINGVDPLVDWKSAVIITPVLDDGTFLIKSKIIGEHKFILSQLQDELGNPYTLLDWNNFWQFNTGFNPASGSSEAANKIRLVATNRDDLISQDSTENVPDNSIAYVEQSQGTKFKIFGLGGNYYPEGWYLKINGNWTSDRNDISTELDRLGIQLSDNLIRVKSASDIFNKTINPSSIYFIDNPNITQPNGQSILVPEGGLSLTGYSLRASKLISSEDGTPMFVVDPAGTYSGALNFSNFTIQGSGSNSVIFNLNNDGQTDNENNNIDWINITFVNCSDLGILSGYRQGFWDVASSIFCGGITLTNGWSGGFRASSFRVLHSDTDPFFKVSPTLVLNGRFFTDVFYTGFGSHGGFCGYNPNNISKDGDFQIVDATFEVAGSTVNDISDFFPNMPISSTKAFYDSIGIEKTNVGGKTFWLNTVNTTYPSANTWVNVAGNTELRNGQWTVQNVNGEIEYLSAQPISGSLETFATLTGGTNDIIKARQRHFRAATNDTITLDETRVQIPLFGTVAIIMRGDAEINQGDKIFIQTLNESDTAPTAFLDGSKNILGKR